MKTCLEREQSLLRHQTNKLIVHKCYGFQVGSVSLDVPTSQGPGWFRTSLRPQRQRQSWANICPGSSGDSIFRFLVREGERATADWATRVCVSVVRLHQRHFDPPPRVQEQDFYLSNHLASRINSNKEKQHGWQQKGGHSEAEAAFQQAQSWTGYFNVGN